MLQGPVSAALKTLQSLASGRGWHGARTTGRREDRSRNPAIL